MGRNIDLLAIALLLAGAAFWGQARRAAAYAPQSVRWVQFRNHRIRPLIAPPKLPRLCLARD